MDHQSNGFVFETRDLKNLFVPYSLVNLEPPQVARAIYFLRDALEIQKVHTFNSLYDDYRERVRETLLVDHHSFTKILCLALAQLQVHGCSFTIFPDPSMRFFDQSMLIFPEIMEEHIDPDFEAECD